MHRGQSSATRNSLVHRRFRGSGLCAVVWHSRAQAQMANDARDGGPPHHSDWRCIGVRRGRGRSLRCPNHYLAEYNSRSLHHNRNWHFRHHHGDGHDHPQRPIGSTKSAWLGSPGCVDVLPDVASTGRVASWTVRFCAPGKSWSAAERITLALISRPLRHAAGFAENQLPFPRHGSTHIGTWRKMTTQPNWRVDLAAGILLHSDPLIRPVCHLRTKDGRVLG